MENESEDEDDSEETDGDEDNNCTCDGAQKPSISDQKAPDNRDCVSGRGRENAPSMIFGYLDRGSLGPGLTGAKSGCGPGDQGFKNRIINGSKPVGLRTRLVNNQEIFDVNVAVLVKFFTRNAVGTTVSITESLYSIGPLLLFFFLILHDSLNNKP
ncbi:hypothetical protein N7509_000014 [Penicillium cosmopolitanum]|uniref:Uncharacterized protein n=1 Tax=Penicillium cosmopolitanum TaxID=1131564 RepID=A0A9X0BF49_9EURO|nr:uncharacterized protein N7509_000014 [Penicillium cosmopolitanum]KAJ5414916.1 hypothetical protein N7509_000014 [Penicillium cosmopolitanum]